MTIVFHKFLRKSSYLFHGLGHDLRPGLLGQDLEHRHQGIGEGGEIDVEFTGFVVLQIAEQLHGNAGGDEQQVDGEQDKAEMEKVSTNKSGPFPATDLLSFFPGRNIL